MTETDRFVGVPTRYQTSIHGMDFDLSRKQCIVDEAMIATNGNTTFAPQPFTPITQGKLDR